MKPGWRVAPIRDIADVNPGRGKRFKNLEAKTEVTFVPMSAVDEASGIISRPEMRAYCDVRKGFTHFCEGDVIFAKITPCMQNGKSAVARNLRNGIGFGSTEFHVLRAGDKVLPEWLWHFIRQPSFLEEARRHFKGSAGQQRVPAEFLEAALIPVPPIDEQRRILARTSECLGRIEEMCDLNYCAQREARALLPSSLASVFHELSLAYQTAGLGTVLADSRYGTSKKCNASEDATPVLRIPNVAGGRVNTTDLKYCALEENEQARLALKSGDILIVRTNGSPELVGRCAVYDLPCDVTMAFASYLIRLRVDASKADPRFVAFFLMSTLGRDAISAIRRTSAGQYNINSENLRSIKLPLPPLPKQEEVAELLQRQREIIWQIASEQMERSHGCDGLKPAVLRKAFRGEL
ncbi:restriction endonuclease subunit S [Mesoterricola sediminis]|uniref:Type I restriction modification DNA specificity domain-containing protein n=1 Tax=Mesoterricola sediminis TaxID=2927980 RepID=A0AA48H1Z1_9BACT|nr:restriction endonuclease subunit S [Mesoterricola sediminis]BDU78152.1 hypothetical protein METESE_31100 [Mesoterricola sediminis]